VHHLFSIFIPLVSAGLLAPVYVTAQTTSYPQRAIQLVVPYTPGTTADTLARVLGTKLAERWKVAAVTDNKAGATGIIANEYVARAAPDGYTLLFTATAHGTVPALKAKLSYDAVRSFTPISLLGTSAMALVVAPQSGFRSVRELLDASRKQPGKLHYSSTGSGGPQHLTMELLKQEIGFDLVHVPYKGSAGAMADLVAGHVQASVASLQTAAPFIQSGKLKMLAVLSADRSGAFADVPTLKETGTGSLIVETWYGVLAPAGLPPEITTKLNSEFNALLQLPDVREHLARQGVVPAGGRPERLGELITNEVGRWARVVKNADIKAD
jgi:tripartite-type tricarboxylate transporter receptor subunit TctC